MLTNASDNCVNDRSMFTDSSFANFVGGGLETICLDCNQYAIFHFNVNYNNPCRDCNCQATKEEILKHHNLLSTASGYGLKCVCGHPINFHIFKSESQVLLTPIIQSKKPNLNSTPTHTSSSVMSFPTDIFPDSDSASAHEIYVVDDESVSRSFLDVSTSSSISMDQFLQIFKDQIFYPFTGFLNIKDEIFCNPLLSDTHAEKAFDETLLTLFNKSKVFLQNYAALTFSLVSTDLTEIRHQWGGKNDGGCLLYLGYKTISPKSKELKYSRKNQLLHILYQLYVLRTAYNEGVQIRKNEGTFDLSSDSNNSLCQKLSNIPDTLDDIMLDFLPLLHAHIQNTKKPLKSPQKRTGTVLLQADTSIHDSYDPAFLKNKFGILATNKGNFCYYIT